MPKIIKNGLEYSGVPVEVVTAWAPTSDPVQVKEPLMGNTDISEIGDGSITGAISELNAGLASFLKVGTFTGTTSDAGTLIITKPSGCTHIITILDTSVSGNYYFARYSEVHFGFFHYTAPHNPATNTSVTVTFLYY